MLFILKNILAALPTVLEMMGAVPCTTQILGHTQLLSQEKSLHSPSTYCLILHSVTYLALINLEFYIKYNIVAYI